MTGLDRFLRGWRGLKVGPYLSRSARVLDIGCGDGSLFRQYHGRYSEGVGVDPALERPVDLDSCRLIPGHFPDSLNGAAPFDVISLLAVLEHIPPSGQAKLAADIGKYLKRGGYLIVTVPAPSVDVLLTVLRTLRLVHGIALEQHYGFSPGLTPGIFGAAGLTLVKRRRFQLGLNHLFVFQKPHA